MKSKFNEMIVLAEKKGGSMAAIFKLIGDLTEFENKVKACASSQEMGENKQKIQAFLPQFNKMYEELFEMAKGSIAAIRSQSDQDKDKEQEEIVESPVEESPATSGIPKPTIVKSPQAPKM